MNDEKDIPDDQESESELKKYGISIMTGSVKMKVTMDDLKKQERREIGKKIDLKLDENGNFDY